MTWLIPRTLAQQQQGLGGSDLAFSFLLTHLKGSLPKWDLWRWLRLSLTNLLATNSDARRRCCWIFSCSRVFRYFRTNSANGCGALSLSWRDSFLSMILLQPFLLNSCFCFNSLACFHAAQLGLSLKPPNATCLSGLPFFKPDAGVVVSCDASPCGITSTSVSAYNALRCRTPCFTQVLHFTYSPFQRFHEIAFYL